MQATKIQLSKLHLNTGQLTDKGLPRNPRFIKDDKFHKLVQSLRKDPEMMELREIIAYDNGGELIIIGGNMRYRAAKELGIKELPCKVLPQSTPIEKLRAYAIKDNVMFGENDWDILSNEWNAEELTEWGVNIEQWTMEEESEKTDGENEEDDDDDEIIIPSVADVLFESNNEYEIPCLKLDMQAGKVELPLSPWGADSRLRKDISTYHFYVDDYRFEKLWRDPINLLTSGAKAIVEPNCSCHDQTPIAYGLQLIYKKRWLARYCQEYGIKVFADLNVAPKFINYNMMGIPKGYNAFFTRGLAGAEIALLRDIDTAQTISGLKTPNLIVYGGGESIKNICKEHSLLYITDFINSKTI